MKCMSPPKLALSTSSRLLNSGRCFALVQASDRRSATERIFSILGFDRATGNQEDADRLGPACHCSCGNGGQRACSGGPGMGPQGRGRSAATRQAFAGSTIPKRHRRATNEPRYQGQRLGPVLPRHDRVECRVKEPDTSWKSAQIEGKQAKKRQCVADRRRPAYSVR